MAKLRIVLTLLFAAFAPFSAIAADGVGKVRICHIPPGNPENAHTIIVAEKAINAHLAHGDLIGNCLERELSVQEGIIPTIGGGIELTDFAQIEFPPDSFPADQNIRISATADPVTAVDFLFSGLIYESSSRASFEVRINTGANPPAKSILVALQIPGEFIAEIGPDDEIQVFAQVLQDTPNALYDHFELFPSVVDQDFTEVVAELPPSIFARERTEDGTFEAVILIATTPSSPETQPATLDVVWSELLVPLADSFQAAGFRELPAVCEAGPLDSPLFDPLGVTDAFGGVHRGTDYGAAGGDAVFAAANGTVIGVGFQVSQSPNRYGGRVRGWGHFIAIRHAVGQTLYAHLEEKSVFFKQGNFVRAGELIGFAGSTGGATGPHLHLEYARSGLVFKRRASKIDPDPCIRPFFVKVDPRGTYLFTDAEFDSPGAPSSFSLTQLNLNVGEFLELRLVGAFKAGVEFSDNIKTMLGVFQGGSGKLSPGPDSTLPAEFSLPTFHQEFPTDIPQDFGIGEFSGLAQVPTGASSVLFSPNDSFFGDNSDPNGDYGVAVRAFRRID